MDKLDRPTDLVDTVKRSIFCAILEGELQPGEILRQEKIADQLGVSRQPVSHALRILAEQGILELSGKTALKVVEIDIDKMMQIMDIRIQLDALAAKLAARKVASGKMSVDERKIVEKLKRLVKKHQPETKFNLKRFLDDDIYFHFLIRKLSGNPFIQETLEAHLLHVNRFMYLMIKQKDPQIWIEHDLILNAILAGDAVAAERLSGDHIVRASGKIQKIHAIELGH